MLCRACYCVRHRDCGKSVLSGHEVRIRHERPEILQECGPDLSIGTIGIKIP